MLIERIYDWARSQPKKTAIIYNDVPINYASCARAIDAARRFLEPHALTAAGRTAIVFANSLPDAWVLLLALRSLGLNTIYLESIEDVEKLKLRDVAFVVSHPDSRPRHLASTEVIVVPTTIYGHASEVPVIQPNNPPFGGHIIYTSGTTGTFKKLLLDSTFDDRRNETRARIHPFSKDTITYETDQLSRGTGAKSAPAVWHVGGCVVYDGRPNPLSRIFRHGVNSLKLTPHTLRKLLRSLDTSGPMDHDFELIIGAGFLSVTLAEETMRRLTRRLVFHYGASEMGATPLLSRFTATEDMHWLAPAEGRTIEIVDENGSKCREGELRIPLTEIDCTSYLDDEEASAKVFRNGFFYPGDMAVRRADGRIRILGRVDDVLNVQGEKFAVGPIEHEIQQQLGVDEVCLFSGLNAAGNEVLAVAVQSTRQLSRSEVEVVVRRYAPFFERVRVTVFSEFPRTETRARKTRRSVLKKLLFGEMPLST
jgi:acyl-coenzyme A synthetase/AMP-(fatty) acid ligase